MIAMMENCVHGNSAPEETLELLPESQAGLERHKCTICAYEAGFEIGLSHAFSNEIPVFQLGCNHGKTAPEYIIVDLPESQAGTGRHKCAICAFHEGLIEGLQRGKENIFRYSRNDFQISKGSLFKVQIPPRHKKLLDSTVKQFTGVKIDYPKVNADRLKLGYLGELLVLRYEKELLIQKHLDNLASRVQHTSKEKGDGLGYDILSFTTRGENKFIEVKTTAGSINSPFYMSENEVEFAKQNPQYYYLYRVFEMNERSNIGKFFVYQGDISKEFNFSPINYQVTR
jgi:hypothetical protein